MVAQVIQIGKRRWLAGMDWRTYADMPSSDDLKQDAEQTNSTWVALRTGEHSIQGGFCPSLDEVSLGHLNGRINGLYSLAAMLADSRQQPWLGTFKIAENLWWYIAVRDGHAIIPKGDVLGDKDAIAAARDEHSGLTDWNYINGDLDELEALIDEVLSKESPTPVKSMVVNWKLRKAMAAAGLLTVAVIGGSVFWWKDQADKKQAVELARIRAQALQNLAPPVTTTNATNFPSTNQLLSQCASAVNQEVSKYGWMIEKVSCDTSEGKVVWKRFDGATIEHRPEGVLTDDGMAVIQVVDLRLEQSSKDDSIAITDARRKLLAWAQAANITLSEDTPQVQALPGSEANEGTAAPISPEKGVTISIGFSPFDLDMSGLPGLRIHEIESKDQGQWSLKGVLYGN